MATSPKMSFKGWNLITALARNKDTLKYIGTIIIGFNAYQSLTGFDWRTFLFTLCSGILTLLVKIGIDAFDFYFSEVTIPDVTPEVIPEVKT